MTKEETKDMLRIFRDVYGLPRHVADGTTSLLELAAGYHLVLKDLQKESADKVVELLLATRMNNAFPLPAEIYKACMRVHDTRESNLYNPKEDKQ